MNEKPKAVDVLVFSLSLFKGDHVQEVITTLRRCYRGSIFVFTDAFDIWVTALPASSIDDNTKVADLDDGQIFDFGPEGLPWILMESVDKLLELIVVQQILNE